jgi:transposase
MRLAITTPLSQDLRRRIVSAVEKGSSIRQAAARYEVSPFAAVNLMRRLRETGSVTPERIGGHRRPVLELHQDQLQSLLGAKSGITLAKIQTELRAHGIEVQALPDHSFHAPPHGAASVRFVGHASEDSQ